MDPRLVGYLTFTAVLVVTPGSTTAVVVRNTLAGGRAAGFAAAFGAALANTSHATAAGLGLAVVFARWPAALSVLRLAGAAYLAWLGVTSIRRVLTTSDGGMRLLRSAGELASRADEGAPNVNTWTAGFRQGLTVNLLNPAIATFYLVVVPTFLPGNAPLSSFALLASLHVTMAFVCHGLWALALDTLRRLFHSASARRTLEGATAVALIGLAVRILIQ